MIAALWSSVKLSDIKEFSPEDDLYPVGLNSYAPYTQSHFP